MCTFSLVKETHHSKNILFSHELKIVWLILVLKLTIKMLTLKHLNFDKVYFFRISNLNCYSVMQWMKHSVNVRYRVVRVSQVKLAACFRSGGKVVPCCDKVGSSPCKNIVITKDNNRTIAKLKPDPWRRLATAVPWNVV